MGNNLAVRVRYGLGRGLCSSARDKKSFENVV
jgi:hypothetical protein